jgi:putative hydrolase of the HAD superfamily
MSIKGKRGRKKGRVVEKVEKVEKGDRKKGTGKRGQIYLIPAFWDKLEAILPHDRSRTLLADDTAKVLRSAKSAAMGYLIYVAKPSSRQPVRYSPEFPSIVTFDELIRYR